MQTICDMIASDTHVQQKLKSVKTGDVVHIVGYLTNIHRNDGWRWRSSTSCSDSGFGTCELVYVKDIKIIKH